MKNILKFAIALILASGPAFAFTFNDATPSCILCSNPDGFNDLAVEDQYRLDSADFFIDDGGGGKIFFDIGLEVVRKTTPIPGTVTAFNTVQIGGFVEYKVRLLTDGGGFNDFFASTTDFVVQVEDIDSNRNQNFSEYAGFSGTDGALLFVEGDRLDVQTYAGAPTEIKNSLDAAAASQSFDPNAIPPADLAKYQFAYAEQIDGSWTDVENTPIPVGPSNDPDYTVAFAIGNAKEFKFIWGTTSNDFSGDNIRGWNIALSNEPLVGGRLVPEIDGPVMVQVGFALMGLYVLMLGRRRREDEVDTCQAAAV